MTSLDLKRAPLGPAEELLIEAFSSMDHVDQIWVRWVHQGVADADRGSLIRVWLAFSILTFADDDTAKSLRDEVLMRLAAQGVRCGIELQALKPGVVPGDMASRIWDRTGLLFTA